MSAELERQIREVLLASGEQAALLVDHSKFGGRVVVADVPKREPHN